MRFEDREIKSIGDLIKNLKDDRAEIKKTLWFRGLPRNFELLPSVLRPDNTKPEIEWMKEFKKDALLIVEPIPRESYEWLLVMRHNHIPTRLLDWTESPLIALYFALNEDANNGESKEDEPGMLWVLSPHELNKHVTGEEEKTLPSFQETPSLMEPYSTEVYSDTGKAGKQNPIAFLAPRNTERMQSQQSVFTIHHKNDQPIEEIEDGNHVWRYIIPVDVKENIKTELKILGINKFQLFPELPIIYEKIKEDEV